MKKFLNTYQVLSGIALSAFSCFPAEAATFNVLGTETINSIDLSFLISDTAGSALPTRSWNKADKYQDEATDKFLNLKYWDVSFKYDAATTSIELRAFHLVDPHTSMPDNGDTFTWNVPRPTATNPLGTTGALQGTANTAEVKDHLDSLGKHSDQYTATASYTTNRLDPQSRTRVDEIGVGLNGQHVPEPSDFYGPTIFGLFMGGGYLLKRKRKLKQIEIGKLQ